MLRHARATMIECYYGECQYHSCNFVDDEGPFCYERECLATPEQIVVFSRTREEWLRANNINSPY